MLSRLIKRLQDAFREDRGVLTFEWVLLLTLLVLGVVSGLSSARDAIIDELGDLAEASVNLDQSFNVAAFSVDCDGAGPAPPITAPGFSFTDSVPTITRCDRATTLNGQGP